jgi:hypothetical protein
MIQTAHKKGKKQEKKRGLCMRTPKNGKMQPELFKTRFLRADAL